MVIDTRPLPHAIQTPGVPDMSGRITGNTGIDPTLWRVDFARCTNADLDTWEPDEAWFTTKEAANKAADEMRKVPAKYNLVQVVSLP